jgi:hypothetical protein
MKARRNITGLANLFELESMRKLINNSRPPPNGGVVVGAFPDGQSALNLAA